jgi:hypothetical protein
MPQTSWLFVRDGESIWIERQQGCNLFIAGPGAGVREDHDFPDEAALEEFQIALAERLAGEGWFLWAFDRDRRSERDRRQTRRNSTDRRQTLTRVP